MVGKDSWKYLLTEVSLSRKEQLTNSLTSKWDDRIRLNSTQHDYKTLWTIVQSIEANLIQNPAACLNQCDGVQVEIHCLEE
jgi:hypothetical protein